MCPLVAIGLLLAPVQAGPAGGIAELEANVRNHPASASAWKELGMALVSRRKPEQALEAFAKACELAPNDEDACYFLGRQLFSLFRYREAVAPFHKAILAAPKEKLARTHRAAALNQIGNGSPEEAERHFREAVRVGHGPVETRAEAQTDYGAFLFRQARIDDALATLEQAAKLDPRLARAHTELGRVLLHLNRPRQAAAALERAVGLDGRSPAARLLLGRAYLALGRSEEGERQLRLGREGWEAPR